MLSLRKRTSTAIKLGGTTSPLNLILHLVVAITAFNVGMMLGSHSPNTTVVVHESGSSTGRSTIVDNKGASAGPECDCEKYKCQSLKKTNNNALENDVTDIRSLNEPTEDKGSVAVTGSLNMPLETTEERKGEDEGSETEEGEEEEEEQEEEINETPNLSSSSTAASKIFPSSIGLVVAGASRVKREDFIQAFDIGVPWDRTRRGNEEVVVLYTTAASFPTRSSQPLDKNQAGTIPRYSLKDATENCHQMKLILNKPTHLPQCIAIIGQWDSFHIHNLMRLPQDIYTPFRQKGRRMGRFVRVALNKADPFRYVSRLYRPDGRKPRPPMRLDGQYRNILSDYLQKLPDTMHRLQPVAAQAAGSDSTVVVMVCNWGQSELLFNFVCAARSRKLDISNVLLFATDQATVALGTTLGLNVFDVKDAFGTMPTGSARRYGDQNFSGMMLAKIYVVQLVNLLGYDLLFQDVDMIWYANPLSFFTGKEAGEYDLYFQDDGARSSRYAPYSPNTGFYFVRHNHRTEYLFSIFARMGDIVKHSGSHQSALTSILSEFASWKGLSVKVFGVDDPIGQKFPGGYHFHSRKGYMRNLMEGRISAFIFHMSWTQNKDNKIKFFQQMNEWYLQQQCVAKPVNKILFIEPENVSRDCCSATPIFRCHYRDKPSKRPCREFLPIDKGRPSFW